MLTLLKRKKAKKVKWSNETGLVDVYAATEHYSHGTVHWGNDISPFRPHLLLPELLIG